MEQQRCAVVNLDRKEYVDPVRLGDGPGLLEFGTSMFGTVTALAILLTPSHGPRYPAPWAPAVSYPFFGRWGSERVAIVGSHARPEGDVIAGGLLGTESLELLFDQQDGWVDITDEAYAILGCSIDRVIRDDVASLRHRKRFRALGEPRSTLDSDGSVVPLREALNGPIDAVDVVIDWPGPMKVLVRALRTRLPFYLERRPEDVPLSKEYRGSEVWHQFDGIFGSVRLDPEEHSSVDKTYVVPGKSFVLRLQLSSDVAGKVWPWWAYMNGRLVFEALKVLDYPLKLVENGDRLIAEYRPNSSGT